jgi:hypothetical protein
MEGVKLMRAAHWTALAGILLLVTTMVTHSF